MGPPCHRAGRATSIRRCGFDRAAIRDFTIWRRLKVSGNVRYLSSATEGTGRLNPIPTTGRKVFFNDSYLAPLGTRRWYGIDRQRRHIAIGNIGSGRAALAEVGGERFGLSGRPRPSSLGGIPAPLPRRGA